MSDNYKIICTEREIESPDKTAKKVIDWLHNEKIIEREETECVLNSRKLGYKPSDNYLKAVLYDEKITSLVVCGVEVQTEKEVFNAMAFTPFISLICPVCGKNRFDGISESDFYMDNLTEEQLELYHSVFKSFDNWSNNQEALLTCPFCKQNRNVVEYNIGDGICLSNFGLTFWNWPDFRPDFVDKLKELIGIEIKMIVGHI